MKRSSVTRDSTAAGDDTVFKFVGDKGPSGENPGTEASLDIQYIMGVAPHVKSEFWYYQSMDLCADLKRWTSQILSDNGGPNVHSVSYGIQDNLTTAAPQFGCQAGNLEDIACQNFADKQSFVYSH